jgi:hypothetical protein
MEKHGRSASPTTAGLELNRKRFEKAVHDAKLQVNKKVIKFLLKTASDTKRYEIQQSHIERPTLELTIPVK